MRSILFATMFTLFAGCGASVDSHVSALTGKTCEPDGTYQPQAPHGNGGNGNGGNGQCQGTSNGDNCDDLHSGKIDCIGDGNSGQGDDKKHNCMFPQPGCDENGCCDDDLVDPPIDPPSDPTDPTDPPSDPTDPTDPPSDPIDPPAPTTPPAPPSPPSDPTPPTGTTDPTDPTGSFDPTGVVNPTSNPTPTPTPTPIT
ncbi:MAG: hypothetical protein H6Q90_1622 [Deltaproteobacteria bacterium]|nr:hypothetical protein [Deltaproteobacteria bacterium]